MSNVFNSVKGLHPKRNAFSAHTYRNDLTSQLGVNIPIYQQHVVAGTRINVSTSALVRLQALIAPIMDNIDFYVHFWKIPYRLLENDRFTQFISGEIDAADYDALFATPDEIAKAFYEECPLSDSDFTADQVADLYFGNGSLFDYLGYDTNLFPGAAWDSQNDQWTIGKGFNNTTKLNLRPLFAYYMLHKNWYMNENVPYFSTFVEKVDEAVEDQNIKALAYLYGFTILTFGTSLLPHGWDKDYFTSALPNVQYGDPVTLGLAGSAPVSLATTNPAVVQFVSPGAGSSGNVEFVINDSIPSDDYYSAQLKNTSGSSSDHLILQGSGGSRYVEHIEGRLVHKTGDQNVFATADLSEASAITINELRVANALQVFKERQMRFGRRRQEYYKGFFDVTPEDLRLQLPKYLGGGRIPINIADVEQTSQTTKGDDGSAQGNLAGKATAVAGGFAGFTTFCSEESIIIGIAFAMPHITYAQSLNKMLMKTNDPYDYFNPSFEHLGEQQIDNIEIYAGSRTPSGVFGYTPRFNEYRFHNNEMHGEFKSTLAYWTLGRIFSDQPALNADFVYMQPSVFDRIFAVEGQPSMLVSALFRVKLIQPVSKYGTPRLMV